MSNRVILLITLLLASVLAACDMLNEPLGLTATSEVVVSAPTSTQVKETATLPPTSTPEPTSTPKPSPTPEPSPTLEPSPTPEPTPTSTPTATPIPSLAEADCTGLPEGYQSFSSELRGLSFCYPEGWVVEDLDGLIFVMPPGSDMTDDPAGSFGTIIMVYPHEMVEPFTDPSATTDDILGMAAMFFEIMVENPVADSVEEATMIGAQERATLRAHATIDGESVNGLMRGYREGPAMAMSVAYISEEEGHLEVAETVTGSLSLARPVIVSDPGIPLESNTIVEDEWSSDLPKRYEFLATAESPLLVVAFSGASQISEIQLYDSQNILQKQFSSGWGTGLGWQCDPATMTNCSTYYDLGYSAPEAVQLIPEEDGIISVVVGDAMGIPLEMGGQPVRGKFRIGALELSPDAPFVMDMIEGELVANDVMDYQIDALADQPVMAFVQPIGSESDAATLSLALLDASGEEIEEKHNHMFSGNPVLLYWTPREDDTYTVRLTEVEGQPASYELTLLADPKSGRASMAESLPAYADQYNITMTVTELGDLEVEEYIELSLRDNSLALLERTLPVASASDVSALAMTENGQPLTGSSSGDPGTFQLVEEGGEIILQWVLGEGLGSNRIYELSYTVQDVVQEDSVETFLPEIMETKTGSILSWQPIPGGREFGVASAEVRVQMPYDVEWHRVQAEGVQGRAAIDAGGAGALAVRDELLFTVSRDIAPESSMDVMLVFAKPET